MNKLKREKLHSGELEKCTFKEKKSANVCTLTRKVIRKNVKVKDALDSNDVHNFHASMFRKLKHNVIVYFLEVYSLGWLYVLRIVTSHHN